MAAVAVAAQCDNRTLFRLDIPLFLKPKASVLLCSVPDSRHQCWTSTGRLHRCFSVRAFRQDTEGDGKSKDCEELKKEVSALAKRRDDLESDKFVRGPKAFTCRQNVKQGGERKVAEVLSEAEAEFFKWLSNIGEYLVPIVGSGVILASALNITGGDSQLDMLVWSGWLVGVIAGVMIGTNQVLESRCKSTPQNVVITGSTRGLGKALAREFLFSGDHVVIASRSVVSVKETVSQLQQELSEGLSSSSRHCRGAGKVTGISCDVSKVDDVKKLAQFAVNELGSIDIWINNAGMNKGFKPLLHFSDEEINQIVSTNLIGSIICTREAIRLMKLQDKGGHIFNMDGAGSGGSSTPLTAVYGATKCGLRQLNSSLLKECKRSKIGIHTASPGMVLTDLLLSGSSLQNKKAFNIICELPETVARALVPRMRAVKGTGKAINFLTPPRILLAIITAWVRRGRWFDEQVVLLTSTIILC
eukprot:TRINITY_DN6615_c0_g1_i1.p1 TRINITY_DN6615_c0_g1~~TRINITY_DN6615_c0_g1_i1.p1  ORF type:complete len:473 (-),score=63.79 TRINITY_DN6615_c0_g1_i1:99-1517(-)